jgi:hypothetical protein
MQDDGGQNVCPDTVTIAVDTTPLQSCKQQEHIHVLRPSSTRKSARTVCCPSPSRGDHVAVLMQLQVVLSAAGTSHDPHGSVKYTQCRECIDNAAEGPCSSQYVSTSVAITGQVVNTSSP